MWRCVSENVCVYIARYAVHHAQGNSYSLASQSNSYRVHICAGEIAHKINPSQELPPATVRLTPLKPLPRVPLVDGGIIDMSVDVETHDQEVAQEREHNFVHGTPG